MPTLSKSRLLAYRQCPKRLWLEIHHPEYRTDSASTRASFATGHQVGDIARFLYDPQGKGVLLDPKAEGLDHLLRLSQQLFQAKLPRALFEAGFRAEGALASWSINAMLPTLHPDLRYADLDGVQDGGMAMHAYLEALSPDTSQTRKTQIDHQLRSYCALDTLALVRLWSSFTGQPVP